MLAHRGHPAPDERGDDDAALAARRRIRVSAGSPPEDAVGAGEDVDIESGVDLQGRQDHKVQLVHKSPLVGRVGVLAGAHLIVTGRAVDGVHRVQIKILNVDNLAHLSLFQQLHHGAADAADGPAHPDALPVHILLQKQVSRQRGPAHAGLEGEAVLEIGCGGNDLRHVFRHHQVPGILGDPGGGGGNLLRVADGIHHNHRVHVNGLHAGGHIGEVHQAVGDHDHVTGIPGVCHGVAHAAAVAFAPYAPAVAHAVAGGGGKKGDINMDLSGLDGPGTAPVAADDGGCSQLPGGDHLAYPAADAAGLNARHLALLDVGGNGVVGAAQAGGGNGNIREPQLLHGGPHNHIYHIIPIPEVVVEGEGHAALRPAVPEGLRQGVHDLALLGPLIPAGPGRCLPDILAVHVIPALIDLPAACQQGVGNFPSHCVFHTRSPSYMPQAFASRSVRSAPGMKAMSIIFPSTVNTPTPASDCSL